MKIKTQEEADEYLEALIDYSVNFNHIPREEAIQIEKTNLSYFAGYYDSETMQRVNRLFCTKHPIFGKKVPTSKEAFEMGKNLAKHK